MYSVFRRLNWELSSAIKERFSKINPKPILVLGNQKSGTTAVAALLGLATRRSVQEDIFCWQGDLPFEYMKGNISFQEYFLKSKQYYSKDIIKEPSLTFFYHNYLKEISPAAIIFILRNPFDNIRSILNRLKIDGKISELTEEDFDRVRSIHQDWYHILKGDLYGHASEKYIESLALRYNKAIESYMDLSQKCILVKYEDFRKNKIEVITDLAKRIGVNEIANFSHRADHQFQPKGKEMDPKNFFSAENYMLIDEITKNARQQVGYL